MFLNCKYLNVILLHVFTSYQLKVKKNKKENYLALLFQSCEILACSNYI